MKVIDGLGAANLIPKRSAGNPSQITPEEGFVLSRVDGLTTLGQICMLVPFDEARTHELLRRLWEVGAIDVPGLRRTVVGRQVSSTQIPIVASTAPAPVKVAARPTIQPAPPPPDADKAEIAEPQRARIDLFFAGVEAWSAFQLLELDDAADAKDVKRAYFRLSKEFHPDRYFGKNIGGYKERVNRIFQAMKNAFETLSDPERRRAYVESRGETR